MRNILPVISLLVLSACGNDNASPDPSQASAGEARALDDAQQMIGTRQPPAEALHAPGKAPAGSGAPQP